MKTLAFAIGVAALVAVTACGRPVAKAQELPVSATATAAPQAAEPFRLEPLVSQLAGPVTYSTMGITLDPVDPRATPPISATGAYSRCSSCPHGTPEQGFRQQLAYFSANTPATMPAECVPQGAPLTSACMNPPTVPIYQHRLAWVFTWYEQCLVLGPVGQPPGPSFSCLNVVPFDATTGDETYSFSGGG